MYSACVLQVSVVNRARVITFAASSTAVATCVHVTQASNYIPMASPASMVSINM